MHATFRQLRLFLALVDEGSVTAAARATHVTQPTASMQLKELADAVGLPLFEVIGKRVHLTEAGRELAVASRNMLNEWVDFEQQIDHLKGLTRGRLKVAVVSTAKYFIPRMLGSFCQQFPDVEIALEILNRDGVVARLRNNADDLYIMSTPPADLDVESQLFMPNPLVVIAPRSHRLARERDFPITRLATERFILREPGSGTRMACEAHFAEMDFRPSVRLQLGSNEAVKQAVAGGMGIAILSRHALNDDPGAESLTILEAQGFPIQGAWYIVKLKGKRLSPIAQAFHAHLVEHASQENRMDRYLAGR